MTPDERALIDKYEKAHSDKLQKGDAAYYSQILKHLLFKCSSQMLDHLKHKGVSMETQYLGEYKFCRALQQVLGDNFGYRLDLSPEQFVAPGYGERKLILVLDVYDMVK